MYANMAALLHSCISILKITNTELDVNKTADNFTCSSVVTNAWPRGSYVASSVSSVKKACL